MSIFGKIKDAIFGNRDAAPAQPTSRPAPVPGQGGATPQMGSPAPAQPAPAQPAPEVQPVDVEAVLSEKAKTAGQDLNWRTSIVDLMKLLGLDSSLENRKELARELNYDGDTNDSAAMNVWLHKHVMVALAYNGGKVPAEMTD